MDEVLNCVSPRPHCCCFTYLLAWLYVLPCTHFYHKITFRYTSPISALTSGRHSNTHITDSHSCSWDHLNIIQSSLSSLARNPFGNISQHLETLKNKPCEEISCGVYRDAAKRNRTRVIRLTRWRHCLYHNTPAKQDMKQMSEISGTRKNIYSWLRNVLRSKGLENLTSKSRINCVRNEIYAIENGLWRWVEFPRRVRECWK